MIATINGILLTILILGLVDYYFIKKGGHREKRFFWPVLVALNLIFLILVVPNLILW